jgi:hypothetical protein
MKNFAIAAALAAAAWATAAYAAQQDFTLINNSGHDVLTLNVSPSSQDSWGPDILGVDILPNGESVDISFDRDEEECVWDIRVTYDDGDTGDWRGFNLCETTTVTLTP